MIVGKRGDGPLSVDGERTTHRMRVVIDCPAFREQLSRAHALAQTGWDEAADYALNWTLSHAQTEFSAKE